MKMKKDKAGENAFRQYIQDLKRARSKWKKKQQITDGKTVD